MVKIKTISHLSIDKLVLDFNNPRFSELYTGSKKQDDLVDYLLNNESADKIADAIAKTDEFFVDKPLWVTKIGNRYLVRDGNRRCAAVIALQNPEKYKLHSKKTIIKDVPVIIYEDEDEISRRITSEHTNGLFRSWDRIAKALEVHKQHTSGRSLDSMAEEIDSKPSDLLKLANFYYEAVKICGDDLKRLLRRGRGGTGGKTIIFERLFSKSKECGYEFRRKSYDIIITDEKLFRTYVKSMVTYLDKYPNTTYNEVNKEEDKIKFLKKLGSIFGEKKSVSSPTAGPASASSANGIIGSAQSATNEEHVGGKGKNNQKKKPNIFRKQLPSAVEKTIDECYGLDSIRYTNAKMAMTRIMFENVLKYVIEETEYESGKKLSSLSHFLDALKYKGKPYTNFSLLKERFQELVINTGIRKAMENYKSEEADQIIHNFNVEASPKQAEVTCNNLMPIIEFMLQDEADLIGGIDMSKL